MFIRTHFEDAPEPSHIQALPTMTDELTLKKVQVIRISA